MDDSTHYFVRNIDAGSINIHARADNTPTTIKSVVNGIIAAGVGNYPYGTRNLFYIIVMHSPRYWPYWRRTSMCLQEGNSGRTGKDSQGKTILLLYQGGVKREPSNAFTIVASILLLNDGIIPRHSNSLAVSGNDKKQKSPNGEVNK